MTGIAAGHISYISHSQNSRR